MRFDRSKIFLLFGAVWLAAGCGGGNVSRGAAEVTIPPYPFWSNTALTVDEEQITQVASAYCWSQGPLATSEDFWLGYLPLEAIDDLGAEEATRVGGGV